MTTYRPALPPASTRDAALVATFRRVLLGLAAATCVGALVELTMLRHWEDLTQLVPWVILAVIGAGVVITWRGMSSPRVVLGVRVLALVSALASAFGVLEHIKGNWETAPLSPDYAATWDSVPLLQQWWLAATGGVGIAPPLAPGFVALSGICLALATIGLTARTHH